MGDTTIIFGSSLVTLIRIKGNHFLEIHKYHSNGGSMEAKMYENTKTRYEFKFLLNICRHANFTSLQSTRRKINVFQIKEI